MKRDLTIRPERPCDVAAIAEVTRQAFLTCAHSHQTEHLIIRELREQGALSVSLVAEIAGHVVGHIGFSAVKISDASERWYGLGPVAVEPAFQRQGVGTALVRRGLERIRERGAAGCVLLGEPDFYQRFGFRRHEPLVLDGVPPEYFLALPFGPTTARGQVTYHAAFNTQF